MAESENKVVLLKESRLFAHAAEELVSECEHYFVQKSFKKGTRLFEQGDSARIVYLIKRGRVRIAKHTADGKEVTVSILNAGDLFGEEVVFSQVRRTTIAICSEDTVLCLARAADLFGLLSRNPVLALNVAKYLRERLDEALTISEDVAYLKVSERLTRLLERLAAEYGKPIPDGTLVEVPLTRAEMASLIGSTRETVSAQIAQLARDGKIRVQGKFIVLLHSQPATALDGRLQIAR